MQFCRFAKAYKVARYRHRDPRAAIGKYTFARTASVLFANSVLNKYSMTVYTPKLPPLLLFKEWLNSNIRKCVYE